MIDSALVALSYLLGSVPTGYILGWLSGIDVRTLGSGNVGATNVARVVGRGQGLLTLTADAAKGWLPIFAAQQLGVSLPMTLLAGAAAFLGHLYPVFLGFKGGKGVATAFGVFLALAPLATLCMIGVFAVSILACRIVSLSSLAAAVSAPPILWLLGFSPMVIVLGVGIAVMIILRHRGNIGRVLAGTEPRLGSSNSR